MSSALIDSLLDLLEPLRDVTARRMFSGHGFYKDGMMFALESCGRLFIKVDDTTRAHFEEASCLPFVHQQKNRKAVMPYSEPPESAFTNPQKMKPRATLGFQAAQRAALKKSKD